MRIAIWGAGAVGLGLATALVRAGERLMLVGRDPATADAIAAEGIRRSGIFGDAHASPDDLVMTRTPSDLVDFAPDWILVCTKAHASADVAEALAPIANALPAATRVVVCQNGWGNEAPFLSFWPAERLDHARVITGFHRRSLVDVEITAHASPIAFGPLSSTPPTPETRALAARVDAGGVPADALTDMRSVLWAKMLYNCALNPLGALAGRRYGELTGEATTRALVDRVIGEIFDVLEAEGISLAWPDADAYRAHFMGS